MVNAAIESYGRRMNYFKGCVTLFGIILNAFQIYGLQINFPPNKVGNFGESTDMNCTDAAFTETSGYIWYKDNSIIYDSVNGDATGTGKYRSSKDTNYFTLEITNTDLNDVGVYRCNFNFQDQSDTLSVQRMGITTAEMDCAKSELQITLTNFYPNSVSVSSVKCNDKSLTGSSNTTPNGNFFDMELKISNVDAKELKHGCDIEISSLLPYNTSVDIDLGTTCTTTSTTSITTVNTNMPHAATSTQPSTNKHSTTNTTTTKSPDSLKITIIGVSVGAGGAVIAVIICVCSCKCIRNKKEIKKKTVSTFDNSTSDNVVMQ